MQKPMSVADHQASRMVVDPLRLFDCCIVSDGAAVVLVTTAERARDLKQRPVYIAGMQGMAAGRNEFIFAPPGLGINQQSSARPASPAARDLAVYRSADIPREAIQGLYTYDAFSPLVLFVLERFGFCAPGRLRPSCRMAASAPAARCRSTPPAACSRRPMSPAGTRSARWCASCGARPGRARSRAPAPCNGRRPGAIP